MQEQASKKLTGGVLGGMGPLATVDFMSKVIALCPIKNEEDHVRLIVDQNPHIPSRQIMSLDHSSKIAAMLTESARTLEKTGVDFIVMPCNTAHMFADNISKAINIPFFHIVDETIHEISKYHTQAKSIGILATSACLDSGIYQEGLIAAKKDFIVPDPFNQDECMRIIFSIKDGASIKDMQQEMLDVAEHLIKRGAEIIIAGCTEIPLILKREDIKVPLISSTEVLALKTVEYANGVDIERIN